MSLESELASNNRMTDWVTTKNLTPEAKIRIKIARDCNKAKRETLDSVISKELDLPSNGMASNLSHGTPLGHIIILVKLDKQNSGHIYWQWTRYLRGWMPYLGHLKDPKQLFVQF